MTYGTGNRITGKTTLSRVGIRGLLVGTGVVALLIFSLTTSAGRRSAFMALAPFKPPSANLDQVRNGGVGCDLTVPNSCNDPADWVNGNAGASNAHYQEGQSIPYRLVIRDLPVGNHAVVIEWDVKHSSANAIDFITHYQRISESVQPCGPSNHPEDIVPGCNPASFTTFDIPAPTGVNSPVAGQPENSFNALPVAQRRMTMYNGTINSMVYTNPQGDLSLAQSSTQITVNFTNTNSTIVMAWGGHIARAVDWGAGNSASGISGSPYHTRLISLDGAGGNQDRSLSAAAVQPPAGCSLTNDNIDVCDLPTTTTHALSGTADASQTYSFSIVNSGGSNAVISSSDTDPSDGTISANVTTSGAGSYTITLTVSNAGGTSQCSATVRVHQLPTVTISLVDACLGTAHLHATVTGGTAPYTFFWKKNGVDLNNNSADLVPTGPGTYSVSVTDSSPASCSSNTDTFVLCFTEGAIASAPAVGPPNNVDPAVKPHSEVRHSLAPMAVFVYTMIGSVIL